MRASVCMYQNNDTIIINNNMTISHPTPNHSKWPGKKKITKTYQGSTIGMILRNSHTKAEIKTSDQFSHKARLQS